MLEIVVLLAVALIVLGPEQLPEVLKVTGKLMRELRVASNTILRELTDVAEEPRRQFRELDLLSSNDKPSEPPKQS